MRSDGQARRPIRSYVLRKGRLTKAQQHALGNLWSKYGLDWSQESGLLSLPEAFGNDHPLALEIGFGDGAHLAALADQHPERNYLGIEVHEPGIGHLLLEAERLELKNLRILRQDALEVLRFGLPESSLAEVYLLFPDPWPKRKHWKRRIFSQAFLQLVGRALRTGGLFAIATDWEPYALHMRAVLDSDGDAFEALADKPAARAPTKFERRGHRLGHRVWELQLRRK